MITFISAYAFPLMCVWHA